MYAKKNSRKAVVVLLALVLLIGCAVGATIAYLQMKTDPIINTFTSSDVSITLTETEPDGKTAKMVPGATITKNPKVTVVAGSEACYVFVKVEAKNGVILSAKTANAETDYITYTMEDGWTPVAGETDVYYKVVDAATAKAGTELKILKGDQVTVLATVTKAMMEAAKTNAPSLTFTAYAIQFNHLPNGESATAADAWALISK